LLNLRLLGGVLFLNSPTLKEEEEASDNSYSDRQKKVRKHFSFFGTAVSSRHELCIPFLWKKTFFCFSLCLPEVASCWILEKCYQYFRSCFSNQLSSASHVSLSIQTVFYSIAILSEIPCC